MIVTLTPNPSIDRTVSIDALQRGEVHRATSSRIDPGGKGINVARALTYNGTSARAVLPAGGPEGHLLEELLVSSRTPYLAVPITGVTRMNIAVIEPGGTTTKLNEPGPTMSSGELSALYQAVAESLTDDVPWVVGCGSLPPGMAVDAYAELISLGHRAGVKVAVDTSEGPLTATIPAGPDLIKPNLEELEDLVCERLATLGEVRDAARQLVSGGIETVVVSLGRHGAVVVDSEVFVHASGDAPRRVSTVGAGDSLLAGYLHAICRGATKADALAVGTAWGSAAVSLPGSRMPQPSDVERIPVTVDPEPDPATPIGA